MKRSEAIELIKETLRATKRGSRIIVSEEIDNHGDYAECEITKFGANRYFYTSYTMMREGRCYRKVNFSLILDPVTLDDAAFYAVADVGKYFYIR